MFRLSIVLLLLVASRPLATATAEAAGFRSRGLEIRRGPRARRVLAARRNPLAARSGVARGAAARWPRVDRLGRLFSRGAPRSRSRVVGTPGVGCGF